MKIQKFIGIADHYKSLIIIIKYNNMNNNNQI